jgi:hypothetical protein
MQRFMEAAKDDVEKILISIYNFVGMVIEKLQTLISNTQLAPSRQIDDQHA